jgi:hypothetical protein
MVTIATLLKWSKFAHTTHSDTQRSYLSQQPIRPFSLQESVDMARKRKPWKPSEKYPTRESYLSQRGSSNKAKGADAEYELAQQLREVGFHDAERGSSKDIVGTQPFHVEAKAVRSALILKWMWQAIKDSIRFKQDGYRIPTVWMKHNDQWYVMVPLLNLRSFCKAMLRILK